MKWIQTTLLVWLISAGFALAVEQPDGDDAAPTPSNTGLMIQNVTLINPLSGAIPDQDILIDGETISAIGPHGSIATFAPVETIDGTGKFVIPALWDAHVHLTFDPELGANILPLFVANGITRVRDTGGLLDKMVEVQAKANEMGSAAPHIYFAGPLVDGLPRVYDGSPSTYPDISAGVNTPSDAIAEVNRLADAGVHFIKSYEMLTPETFKALVAAATERGLPVTSHVPLSMNATDVAKAGVRGMEHLRNLGLSCARTADDLLAARQTMLSEGQTMEGSSLRAAIHTEQRPIAFADQDATRCDSLIETLATYRVFQTPTLALNTRSTYRHFGAEEWQATIAHLPPSVATRWHDLAARAMQAQKDQAQIAFTDWSMAMTAKLHAAQVPIMAGTDTPIGLLTPGFSLHLELERLVQAGLTPLEALTSATLRPAQFFGLEETMGTIEAGRSGDLVILNENPLDDIRNTRSVHSLIVRGVYIDEATRQALLKTE